ncbi:MAG: STAS domain-containing protein [Candidatus Cybelea sp.]
MTNPNLATAVSSECSASVLVIELEGELDLADRDRVTDAFKVAHNSPIVVVNLEKATYIDSTVLGCLVALRKATQERGASLFLVGLRSDVLRLFEVTGLREIFDVRASLSDVDTNVVRGRWLTIEARPLTKHPADRRNGHRLGASGSVGTSVAQQY